MWDKVKSAADWTNHKVGSAAEPTYRTAKNVARPVLAVCASVPRIVGAKSKDIAGVTVGSFAAHAAVIPTLNVVGFTSVGPAAGSWAAAWMSMYAGATPACKPFPHASC